MRRFCVSAVMLVLLVLGAARPARAAMQPMTPAATWEPLPPIPDPLGLAGMYAGVSGDALVAAGGANFPAGMPWEGGAKAWTDRAFVLESPQGPWKAAGQLPRAMAYGASISWDGAVVCIGGSDSRRAYADVVAMRYSGGTITVESLPPLPVSLTQHCAALVGSTAFVAGGVESPDSTVASHGFYALDLAAAPAARRWEKLPSWPGLERMQAVAASRDGVFFLFGGIQLKAGPDGKPERLTPYLRDAYSYKPGNGWKRLADLPRGCAAAPFPAMNIGPAHILVAGGIDHLPTEPPASHPGFPADQLAYHTITDSWTGIQARPGYPGRVTAPAVWWSARYVVVSGETSPGRRSPEVTGGRPGFQKANLGWINYLTLLVFLVAVAAIGWWALRRLSRRPPQRPASGGNERDSGMS